MNIFAVVKEKEGRFKVQYAATQERIEPRAIPPKHSGIATVPQQRVTFILIQYEIF
jgi:hypothetical protein